MRKVFLITSIFIVLIACGFKQNNSVNKTENKIDVIKFMQSVNTYPMAIDEKIFWIYKEEHAKLEISIDEHGNFLEEIKKLPRDNGNKFGLLNYAFLVKTGPSIDTVYADNELKTWNFIKHGKRESYYDADGKNAKELRQRYSFFKDCW